MGNFFQVGEVKNLKPQTKQLIKKLKRLQLNKVLAIFRQYIEHVYPLDTLNLDQFEDLFSPLLNNTKPYFQAFNESGYVDIYQAFIAFTIFSIGNFDEKIQACFTAFDLDDGGSIDRKELSKFVVSAIYGICLVLDMPMPSSQGIQMYTYAVFQEVDKDNGGTIDYEEFQNWIKSSDILQEFLLIYTGVQTLERAHKRYNQIFQEWQNMFDSVSVNFMGTKYAEVLPLKKQMALSMKDIEPSIMEKMFLLMNYEGGKVISLDDFKAIISPWASFSATDINNDNQLDIIELKTLFWLMENKEPDMMRIQMEMQSIDADGGGTIDRIEWISYLITPDCKSGAAYFDFELRKAFNTYDLNQDGRIETKELCCFLRGQLQHELNYASAEQLHKFNECIRELAKNVMNILDPDNDCQKHLPFHQQYLTWKNFKNFHNLCTYKLKQTQQFIVYIVQDNTIYKKSHMFEETKSP